MKNLLTSACLLALAAATCLAQDKAAFEKGQKYLDKVAKVWTAKSPQALLFGLYADAKYIGMMKYTVSSADGGFVVTGEAQMGGGAMKMSCHGKLGPNLCIVSSEMLDESNEGKTKKTISVTNGKWTLVVDKDGKAETKTGDVGPGLTWGATFLPAFAVPDDAEVGLLEPNAEGKNVVLKKLEAKEKVSVDGKDVECSVLETTKGEEKTLWLFGPDGAFVEMQHPGSPMHMRIVTEADLGKDLAGAPAAELSGPAKAVIAVYCAIKRNDEAALEAAFDFDRWVAEEVEGFDKKTDEEKEKAAEDKATQIIAELNTEELRKKLPDEATIAAVMGPQVKVEMAGEGEAVVHLGDGTWKLYQSTDADDKGAWLIYSIK